jgi:MoaA/NifB/PqqE/SkfB family radical SAM enzyme
MGEESVVTRAKRSLRRILPSSAVAALRRGVLRRRPVLHSLETHVTDHCNLNCKGCGHFSCISPPRFTDPDSFDRDATRLAELFDGIEVFSLLGGEPLLHPDVLCFTASARRAFPRAEVHLVTNGLLLPRMSDAFWEALVSDRVRLNVSDYPIARDDEWIRAKAAETGVELWYSEPRERFYKIPVTEAAAADPAASFGACRMLANCPFLEDGRIYPCAYPPLAHILEARFGVSLPRSDGDSIDIHDPRVDGFAVMEFLARPVPFCGRCDFERLEHFDWGRTARSLEEWT